ncbi:uroporphyrinogen decarboxylase family protein [Sporomusa malonica]|uniref:Uroporphyrinogen decarboxylase (URO-D) n=1 Tax=Sporomusa malonica TaxID=112901 RepID=A0A1W1ZFU5_9FIRM|nr:uroporphyrinogen decarboxylase family protein [Sporomusa malonica]SMC47216.1 Uroporphyrinogen decarboxylase (URO-D) [Sporomusa malonica]
MAAKKDIMTAEERLVATINLEPVDRVVCAPMIDQYAGQFAGITNKEFMWDWEKCMDAIDKVHEAFPIWDSNPFIMCERYAPLMKKVGLMRTKMPGVELPDNACFQMHEVEITSQADYDLLIEKGLLEYVIKFNEIAFGTSKEEMFQAMMEKGKLLVDENQRTQRRGQSSTWGILGGSAPDVLSMTRSMECFFKDIFRVPDKVYQAMEVTTDGMIAILAAQADQIGIRRTFIGDSRSSAQWLSLKKFEKLLLPIMKRLVNGLAEKDIIPILHCDSDWTKNLEYFLELPAKKFVLQLDGDTDIFRVKEILGGHCAIMGDMPAALLTIGSVTDVDEYAKKLMTVVGKDGGFIYSSGCCVPMNAKHENMKAYFDAVEKYGRYN